MRSTLETLLAAGQGDKTAINKVIKDNYGLISFIVAKWLRRHSCPRGWSHDDLMQEGRLGMLRAIQTYEPAKGAFSTYAGRWMFLRLRTTLERAHGDPDVEVYLDSFSDNTGWAGPFEVTKPVDLVEQEQGLLRVKKAIRSIRSKFGARGEYILVERILSDSPVRLDDIADRYGFSRERARQIESKVIEHLRNNTETDE